MGTADPIRGDARVGSLDTADTTRRGMSFGTLVPFMAIAFGLTWGIFALLIRFPEQTTAVFGPVGYTNPLFVLAVYAPAIAAFLLVWRHYGLAGVGSFLRRLTLWRMPLPWWLFLVFGTLAVFYIGAAIKGTAFDPFPFSPWYAVLPAAAIALVIGPIEEFGWRGVALPLLQRRFAPLWAGLILGAIWAVWHVPAFMLAGTPQSAWSLTPFLIGVTAIAVILTPMFNAAQGSLLIAALYHFQMNNPAHPNAQPWDTVIFSAVAVVIVLLNRRAMLTRDEAVTSVLYPGDEPATDR
ncbi:MAG: CPBP family intramembrane glutamic endopeptidase [Thermomicrobiales bacterium]